MHSYKHKHTVAYTYEHRVIPAHLRWLHLIRKVWLPVSFVQCETGKCGTGKFGNRSSQSGLYI